MSKQQDLTAKDTVHNQWADAVDIFHNRHWIELRFNASLFPELQSRLRAIGFNPTKIERVWRADDNEANETYASALAAALPIQAAGPELFLKPSFEPVKANIENKAFCFVNISLKNGEDKRFIIFEPSKFKAEVMAAAFARDEFGDTFLALSTQPRTRIREARVLFDEGKIIDGTTHTSQKPDTMKAHDTPENKEQQSGKIPVLEILLTPYASGRVPNSNSGKAFTNWREANAYAKSLVGKFPDVYFKITWADASAHQGWVDLEPADFFDGKEDILSNNITRYFTFLAEQQPNALYSKKDIERAKQMVKGYQLNDNDKVIGRQKPDPEALRKFHEWQTVEGVLQGASAEELMDIKKLNSKIKSAIASPEIPYSTKAYGKLQEIIPDFIQHLIAGSRRDPNAIFEVEKNGKRIKVVYEWDRLIGEAPNCTVDIRLSELNEQEEDEILFLISVHVREKDVYVTGDAFQDYYKMRYNRNLSDEQMREQNKIPSEERARTLCAWIEDLKEEGVIINIIHSEDKSPLTKTFLGAPLPNAENKGDDDETILRKFHKWAAGKPEFKDKTDAASKTLFDTWFSENYPDLPGNRKESVWLMHGRVMRTMDKLSKKGSSISGIQPYTSIYKKILQVIPDLIEHLERGISYGKSKLGKDGMMDLNMNYLGKDKNGNYLIALSHEYEQNGDLLPDPDMQIRIMPDMQMAEAMSFQQSHPDIYQEVYEVRDGKEYVNQKLKPKLNSFLNSWLTNLIRQGHKIDLSNAVAEDESEDGVEVFKNAYTLLTEFTPGFEQELKKGISSLEFKTKQKGGERILSVYITKKEESIYDLLITDHFRTTQNLQYDVQVDLEKKEARASFEWLSFNNTRKYHREESEEEIEERDGDIAEEMTRALTEWLREMIQLGYLLRENTGEKKAVTKRVVEQTEPVDLSGVFTKAFDQLNRLIPNLSEHLEKGTKHGEFNIKVGNGANRKISYTFLKNRTTGDYDIILNEELDSDEQLQSEITIHPSEKKAEVTAEWLSDYYAEKYDRLKSEDELEEEDVTIDEDMTRGLTEWLDEILELGYLIDLGSGSDIKRQNEKPNPRDPMFDAAVMATLIAEDNYLSSTWATSHDKKILKEDHFSKEQTEQLLAFFNVYVINDAVVKDKYRALLGNQFKKDHIFEVKLPGNTDSSSKTVVMDLKSKDVDLPNVLVPVGLKEPFISKSLFRPDIQKIVKADYKDLMRVNKSNLHEASPLEMLCLIKLSHPNEYGIDVDRMTLLREWEKRGKKIFKALGLPVEKIYPYANLYQAYKSIETLETVLNEYESHDSDEWWKVADNYYPVADMHTALRIIDKEKEDFIKEKDLLVNDKTGKPKIQNKEKFRDIEFKIKDLVESRKVIMDYITSDHDDTGEQDDKQDPLTNDHGVFTKKSAGGNLEEILIPMPKGAKYRAEVRIAKTSEGDFVQSISCNKQFGDANSYGSAPSIHDKRFPNRKEALTAGLDQVYSVIQQRLRDKDDILNNEDAKNKHLTLALNAVLKFANENGVALSALSPPDNNSQKNILKGLETAYWTDADNEYPVNKVTIKEMDFAQHRLREVLQKKLQTLPIPTIESIKDELAHRFQERRSLDTYEKGLVTTGKKGDKRKAAVIASYVDDMVIDNDLKENSDHPVMTFLLDLLFDTSQKLADLPQQIEKQAPTKIKKQSQHELNQEIEALIDKKDDEGSAFSTEEKIFIRQYTGSGGLINQGATGRGVLYEYYTPEEVVKKAWGLAQEYGYKGGRILEPAVGTGNFLWYAPENATIFGFETNHYSARIAQVLFPKAHIFEKAFESLFFAGNTHLKDDFNHELYNLVIGNPPYGDFTGRYAGMGEKRWTGASEYDQYFILRGLDLLEKNGLLIFVLPHSFIDSGATRLKEKIARKCNVLDSYRFPNGTFNTTDIGTDILVLKKR